MKEAVNQQVNMGSSSSKKSQLDDPERISELKEFRDEKKLIDRLEREVA